MFEVKVFKILSGNEFESAPIIKGYTAVEAPQKGIGLNVIHHIEDGHMKMLRTSIIDKVEEITTVYRTYKVDTQNSTYIVEYYEE